MRRSILVAGTARSGTTWLADVIASQLVCRIMFEPFNPELVREYRGFNYFQYMRPEEEDGSLHFYARRVFSGELRNRWVDRQNENLFAEYRLVKEIRANLMLKWLHRQFPEVPVLFLLRHPCAVVLSRMELGWATDRDIQPLLSQPALVSDYLDGHMDLIRNVQTDEEKHTIIWCVSNLVPLNQFRSDELKIIYYEDLCVQPDVELPAAFAAIGVDYDRSTANRLDRPSQTTRATSAVVTGSDRVSHWQKKLNPVQVERILRIVQAFGLDHLYQDSPMPMHPEISSRPIQSSSPPAGSDID